MPALSSRNWGINIVHLQPPYKPPPASGDQLLRETQDRLNAEFGPIKREEEIMPFENKSFSHALDLLKNGLRVQRAGWNGIGMWIAVQRPDENSKMSLPYIYMKTVAGDLVPWLASQTDILSEDWRAVE